MEIEYQKDQVSKQEIKVIKGIVTYEADDDELTPLPKIKTKGKKATVKHKNTMYTHEVRVEGNDTIDIVNVYKGSVEVLYFNPDFSSFENTAEEMEKLSKDYSEGKITMEEFSAKMNEFVNISQEISKYTEPVIVEEGNKCIVTKNSITVEPGTDTDRWWEE